MGNGRSRIACLAALILAGPANAESQQHFKPVGPWAMEYADQTCRLIRNFSDGNGVVTLAFEKSVLGTGLSLGLAGKSLKVAHYPSMTSYRYNGEKRARTTSLLTSVLTDGRDSFLLTAVPFMPSEQMMVTVKKAKPSERFQVMNDTEMAAANKTTSISLTDGFVGDPEFEIGPMAAPLRAMRTCVEDLVSSWGVDPQRIAAESRAAEPMSSPFNWLSRTDYPDEMLRAHKGGVVPFRLIVDENGAVMDCIVTIERRGPFEEAVCKGVSKRARFRPALDADGKPMRSYWAHNVVFYPN